ncbi:hypothetical protein GCM10028857_01440 [Salinarchaeum chitinilyticum]
MAESDESLNVPLSSPGENRLKRWLLLTGGRMTVTLVLMAAVFGVILGLALLKPVGMHELLNESNATQRLFSSLLSGAILLVSVVVSINSVVLSQEITDLEDQEARIEASLDFHRRVEGYIEADVTPARPADFMVAVLYGISTQLRELTAVAADSTNEAFRSDVQTLAEEVSESVQRSRWALEKADMGAFEVLLAGLDYDYSEQLHAIRGLKRKHAGDLTDEETRAIDELIDVLQHVGTSREYFKSLYYKRELAYLSSRLLYVALPVIVFTSYVILAIDAGIFPNVSVYGLSPLLLSVVFAYAVALTPYLVLTSYVVRSVSVTLRTLAAGPFILQEDSDIESLDWDVPEPKRDWALVGDTEYLTDKLEEGADEEE